MPDAALAFTRLTRDAKIKLRGLRGRVALSSLERRIAKALMITDGHKKAGVPAGDERYLSIYENTEVEIGWFCDKYEVDRWHIDAQIPGLKLLKDMTVPAKPNRQRFLLIFLAALVGLSLIGAMIGYIRFIADFVARTL
jgi:preprotein translocase subunit Sss1